jgi:hypothetical protein
LVEVAHDKWFISTKDGVQFNGTFRNVVYHMVANMGFDVAEIDYAIKELMPDQEMLGHNAIHFGMYKRFLFTCQKEIRRKAG